MGLLKSNTLQPTKENLLKTLQEDLFGRNEDLFYFVSLLNQLEDNCVIGLDGQWGSGKTFFVKHAKMILDACNQTETIYNEEEVTQIQSAMATASNGKFDVQNSQWQVSVYYDAWLNDETVSPILSLIYTILETIPTDYPFKDSETPTIEQIAEISEFLVQHFAPDEIKNPASKIIDLAGKLLSGGTKEDIISPIRKQKAFEEKVSEFLNLLMEERGNRLVIFIDELDRCKPSYSVQLLEQIKHYFSNERVTFVFSVNSEQLQHTIKQVYGADFDAIRYLDRFFDYRLPLPPANVERYCSQSLPRNRFDEAALFCLCYRTIIRQYNFSIREIERFTNASKVAVYSEVSKSNPYKTRYGKAKWLLESTMVPLLIALSMTNSKAYMDFINGRGEKLFVDLLNNSEAYRFIGYTFLDINELQKQNTALKRLEDKELMAPYEDKLREVYQSVWRFPLSQNYEREVSVGEYTFTPETKSELLKTISLLSSNANYVVDEQ